MDNPPQRSSVIEADGISVKIDFGLRIASLRYFDAAGGFAGAVREILGRPLPQPLHAVRIDGLADDAHCILAWRSPTETLFLSSDVGPFNDVERRLADAPGGCLVNQTGGIRALRVRGSRTRDLLLRLGAPTAIPGLGEARSSRLAELQVLVVCVQSDELILLVERVYADHLLEWMAVTVADLWTRTAH
jgi:sarcosine oxidase gamma subunit